MWCQSAAPVACHFLEYYDGKSLKATRDGRLGLVSQMPTKAKMRSCEPLEWKLSVPAQWLAAKWFAAESLERVQSSSTRASSLLGFLQIDDTSIKWGDVYFKRRKTINGTMDIISGIIRSRRDGFASAAIITRRINKNDRNRWTTQTNKHTD